MVARWAAGFPEGPESRIKEEEEATLIMMSVVDTRKAPCMLAAVFLRLRHRITQAAIIVQ